MILVNEQGRRVSAGILATATANMHYTLNGATPSQTNGNLIDSNHGTASVTPTSGGTTLRGKAKRGQSVNLDTF